jgi:O-antigen ligase
MIIYFHTKETYNLTYTYLSFLMHPSYLAMYLNFSLMVVFFDFSNGKKSKVFIALRLFLFLFFIFIIILLSSKAGLLSLFIAVMFMLSFLIYKKQYISVSVITICSAIIFFSATKFARVTDRIKTAFAVVVNYKSASNQSNESTSERIFIWKASANVIKNNLVFGVGTGDAREELVIEYKKDNMPSALANSLNAHNQYFQTAIAIGLLGLLVFLLSLFIPFYLACKSRNWIYLFFLLLVIVNFLFESMLERQMGVVFYAFFNALLFSRMNNNMYKSKIVKENSISNEKKLLL